MTHTKLLLIYTPLQTHLNGNCFPINGPHVFQEPLRSIGEMLVECSGMGVSLGGEVEARK